MKLWSKIIGGLAMTGLAISVFSQQPERPDPLLTIPWCSKPPVIDGRLDGDEWKFASCISMLEAYSRPVARTMRQEQPLVYVMWDNQYLYIAMDSVESNTNSIVVRHTQRDMKNIIADDCLELMLSPGDLQAQADKDFPTYYFAVNSIGGIWDALYKTQRNECHNAWNADLELASTVEGTRWICEMRIPFASLRGKIPEDGTEWRMNFARNYFGYFWSAWKAGALNSARVGGNVIFRRSIPAIRLLSGESLLTGKWKLDLEVSNGTNLEQELVLSASVSGGEIKGDIFKPIATDEKNITLPPGESKLVSLGKEQKLAPFNTFVLQAHDKKKNRLFFLQRNVQIPVPRMAKRVAPKVDLVYVFPRFLPSLDRLAVKMDCTAWMKVNKTTDKKFTAQIKVRAKTDPEKTLFEGTFEDFRDGQGVWRHSTAKLPEGNYLVKVSVLADGKEIVAYEDWFKKKIFPWMKEPLEIGDAVPEPYTPLVVKDNSVSPWNRTISFSEDGLPATMLSRQKTLMKKAASLSLERKGEKLPVHVESAFRFTKKTDGNVEGEATLLADDVRIQIESRTEYDGFTLFRLTYAPIKGTSSIDRMRLKVPLDAKYIRFYSAGTDVNGVNILGEPFPDKQGKVYDSSKDTRSVVCSPTFASLFWTGDYDTSFCYAADSPRGWSIRDDAPAVEVWREGDTVNLFLNLIDKKTEINSPQTLEFAFQTGPTKPLPKQWRGIQDNGHLTDEVPGAPMTRFLMSLSGGGFALYGGTNLVHAGLTEEMRQKSVERVEAAIHGNEKLKPVTYTRWGIIPKGLPETRVFRGEWGIDKSAWDAAQNPTWLWKNKYFGDDKDLYIPVDIQPVPSHVETLTHAYNDVLALTRLYGFYDDTGYPIPVFDEELDIGFVREDGKKIYSSGLWIYRERWKKIAFLHARHQRLNLTGDTQHLHAHFMPAYGFIGVWAPCESGFYNPFPELDNYDFYGSLERYYAINPSHAFGQISAVGMSSAKWEESGLSRDTRSMMMLTMLHDQDVGSFGQLTPGASRNVRTVRRLREARNLFRQWEDDVHFTGYWESRDVVKADSEAIPISLYNRKGSALFIIGNTDKQRRSALLRPDWHKIGINEKNLQIINPETLQEIVVSDGAFEVTLGSHDIMLILAGDLSTYAIPQPVDWCALSGPKNILSEYSDLPTGPNGPNLPAGWEEVMNPGNNSTGFFDGKFYLQGSYYGYGMIRKKIEGAPMISAQCVITSAYEWQGSGGLLLLWKNGSLLRAGFCVRQKKFIFEVNNRLYTGPDTAQNSPFGWNPYLEGAVKFNLTKENIEFLVSADGKKWEKALTLKRGEEFNGSPEYLALGNGFPGNTPYLANVHPKNFKPEYHPRAIFYSNLLVGHD